VNYRNVTIGLVYGTKNATQWKYSGEGWRTLKCSHFPGGGCMPDRSKLVALKIRNLGCVGPEGLEVALDDIVCLVGRNNTGKSTILHAYELAQGSKPLTEHDPCQWTPVGDFPEVELIVHIPDGIANVDERWKKVSGGLKLVQSRWQWKEMGAKPTRQTWDPVASGGVGE